MPYSNPEDRKRYQRDYDVQRRQTHKAVKVTMTLNQYRQFESYAKGAKQTVARALISLAKSKLEALPVLDPGTQKKLDEIVFILRNCANNVNQIAHASNLRVMMDDDPPTPSEGTKVLTKIHEGLVQLEIMVEQKLTE